MSDSDKTDKLRSKTDYMKQWRLSHKDYHKNYYKAHPELKQKAKERYWKNKKKPEDKTEKTES